MKQEIIKRAKELYLLYHPCWRWGQAIFNAAYELYPTETDVLRGTVYDCYYDDNNVNKFLKELS